MPAVSASPTPFQGLWIPLVTPFHDGAVDHPSLARMTKKLAGQGIHITPDLLRVADNADARARLEAGGEVVHEGANGDGGNVKTCRVAADLVFGPAHGAGEAVGERVGRACAPSVGEAEDDESVLLDEILLRDEDGVLGVDAGQAASAGGSSLGLSVRSAKEDGLEGEDQVGLRTDCSTEDIHSGHGGGGDAGGCGRRVAGFEAVDGVGLRLERSVDDVDHLLCGKASALGGRGRGREGEGELSPAYRHEGDDIRAGEGVSTKEDGDGQGRWAPRSSCSPHGADTSIRRRTRSLARTPLYPEGRFKLPSLAQ